MGNQLTYPTVDLSGKVAVVTGGNTGIGYEIAKALAEMGAHTFIACKLQEGATPAVAVSGVLCIMFRVEPAPPLCTHTLSLQLYSCSTTSVVWVPDPQHAREGLVHFASWTCSALSANVVQLSRC